MAAIGDEGIKKRCRYQCDGPTLHMIVRPIGLHMILSQSRGAQSTYAEHYSLSEHRIVVLSLFYL